MASTVVGPENGGEATRAHANAKDPAVVRQRGPGENWCQAAEELADEEEEPEDDEADEDEPDEEEDELDDEEPEGDFASDFSDFDDEDDAGELLDDDPRLSLR